MKKILSIAVVFLMIFSLLALHVPEIKSGIPESSLVQLTTNPYTDFNPSWHPSGSKIAYCAFSNPWDRSIWVLDFSNPSDKMALTSGYIDQHPDYSFDGQKIVFTRWGLRGDYSDIFVMNSDGSNIQRITYGAIPGLPEGCYVLPRWSKDGQRILFEYFPYTSPGGPDSYIYMMDSDGTNIQYLGQGCSPRWCLNDSKILYHYYDTGTGLRGIYIMNNDGTNVVKLTSGADIYSADMSPAGKMVFSQNYPPGDLFLMNADGSNMEKLVDNGVEPEWSPDGKYIVFSSTRSGNRDIWALSIGLSATVDLNPDALNLRSKGEWITAYIEFPEDYDVNDINVSTVMLNTTVPAELHPSEVEDHDGDVVPDLMIKFDRAEVTSYILANVNMTKLIEEKFMTITLTITGELDDGTPFQGSDTITIMLPTHGKGGIFPV